MIRLERANGWIPPADWLRITTVDAHTEGEPLRVLISGYPELAGARILERREDARSRHDNLRTALMWEPRGHPDMYGCLIVPAERPDSDFGVLFLHNEGYSTMCGHGIIAVVTVLVQLGVIEAVTPETTVRIDAPAARSRPARISRATGLPRCASATCPPGSYPWTTGSMSPA